MYGVKSNDRGHFLPDGGGRTAKPTKTHRMLGNSGGKKGVKPVSAAPRVGVSKPAGK